MKSLREFVGNVHVVQGTDALVPQLLQLVQESGIEISNNPDVYIRTYAQFGIDEAREMRERASSKALGARRAFILSMPHMTHEAQNALLKVLEEPPADSLFFFILPAPEALLPTLRSRTQTLRIDVKAPVNTATVKLKVDSPRASSSPDVDAFLKAAPAKRLDMLKPLLEKDEDEKRDLSGIIMFLSSLERMLGERRSGEGLEAVYRARRYMGDKGALIKPLLEQMALLVPRI